MPVEVEIKAKQIYGDHEETEENKCQGEINYHEQEVVLEFTEKNEELGQELHFKMTILEDKIITIRNNQTMIFDKKNKNHSTLETPYGKANMTVTTKEINIIKEENKIKKIEIIYEIELENAAKYENQIEVKIS